MNQQCEHPDKWTICIERYRDNALTELRKKFEKAKKQRDDLKLTLEKFENSSKNLSKLLDSQICDNFKTSVRFDSQVFDNQVNDKYKIAKGYHAVLPPYTGNFMPPKPDLILANVDECVVSETITIVPAVATNKAKTSESKPKSNLLVNQLLKIGYLTVRMRMRLRLSLNRENLVLLRHMTRNMSYLSEYKEIDGGYVTFGEGAKGGKITGKGTLKSGTEERIANETVHKERSDIVERAATTAASLDAEQDGGGSPRRQDTILGDRPAQTRVLALENNKTAQDLEITHPKKRVKRLEKKRKSKTLQLKRRLFKVRRESSTEKSLGDQEDASNQERNDQNEGISFVQEDAETRERYGHDIKVNTTSTSITTVSINLTDAEPVTTVSAPVTTAGLSISTAEPKKTKEIGSKEKSSETATRPTRGVIMREANKTTTRPTVPPQQKLDPKYKGKDKMVKPEKPLKKKDQIEFDREVAQRLKA
nr:hypothetical protein [Tanacetum cinerariifolium]